MAFAGDVGGDFKAVGETDARDLAQAEFGFSRRRIDARADAAPSAGWLCRPEPCCASSTARESVGSLVYRWHSILTFARPAVPIGALKQHVQNTSSKRRSGSYENRTPRAAPMRS